MRHSLCVIATLFLILPAAALAGETLYNGIVLPDEWPPKLNDAPKDR